MMDSPQRQPERKKTKGKSKADEEEELLAEETTPEPDQEEDYVEWLRWKKRQWKRMRALRKLRRKEGAQPGTSIAKGMSPFLLGVFSCAPTLAHPICRIYTCRRWCQLSGLLRETSARCAIGGCLGDHRDPTPRPLCEPFPYLVHFRSDHCAWPGPFSDHHCAAFLCSVHHRVLVGDALHSLTLEVPRVYYINYRKAPSPHELVTSLPLKWSFVALV